MKKIVSEKDISDILGYAFNFVINQLSPIVLNTLLRMLAEKAIENHSVKDSRNIIALAALKGKPKFNICCRI